MLILLELVLLVSVLPTAIAWGAVGHEIVATIAQIHLHPSAAKRLCDILPGSARCHLAPIAAWADKVRGHYPWTSHMHYVGDVADHPSQHCSFREGSWEDPQYNVLTAIKNTTFWLSDGRPGQEEALKFLVHFVGDMHMPLHLTGRSRGGNGMKVRFDGRVTNLHSVWDGRLIAKFVRTVPNVYKRPIPVPRVERALRHTIYDPYIRQIVWEGIMDLWKDEIETWLSCPSEELLQSWLGTSQQTPLYRPRTATDLVEACPFHWAQEVHKLNCEIVWPPELDQFKSYLELDTPSYSGVIQERRVVERLLAMGGIRLAGLLNALFADVDEGLLSTK